MAVNNFFSERLDIIHECLANRRQKIWTKKALIAEIDRQLADKGLFNRRDKREPGISERTFYDDIKYLKEVKNAPIVCKDGAYKYTSNFQFNSATISKKDAQKLHEAIAFLKELDIVPGLEDIESIIFQLEDAANADIQDNRKIVQFEHHAIQKGLNQYFEVLYNAIKNKIEIVVTYKKFFSKTSKTYIFHPYLLKEYNNRWYVLGKIKNKDTIITLATDRIEKIETTNNFYTPDPSFDATVYFAHAIGITFENNPKPETIKLQVLKKQAPYFENQPLHPSQKKEKIYSNGDVLFFSSCDCEY
jgi:predicted DNA-binding transcriptional regulator YafY